MSQNGHIYFKNLAASVSDHIGTLCIKGLSFIAGDWMKWKSWVNDSCQIFKVNEKLLMPVSNICVTMFKKLDGK